MADTTTIQPGEEVPLGQIVHPVVTTSGSSSARGLRELAIAQEAKTSARRTRDDEEAMAGGQSVEVHFHLPDGSMLAQQVR
jgi:hypothetical protein